MRRRGSRSRRKEVVRKTYKTYQKKQGPNKLHNTIVRTFLEMLNTVKLYHWKTRSYSQHKATDELYERLNTNIDTFIETLLGKTGGSRITLEKGSPASPLDRSETVEEFKTKILEYREFLIGLTRVLHPKRDTDLLNIRDEILGNINQFLYLLTFE